MMVVVCVCVCVFKQISHQETEQSEQMHTVRNVSDQNEAHTERAVAESPSRCREQKLVKACQKV